MARDKDILKTSIVQGFGTLIVREFFLKLLSFVGQIFLARLLAPSDFGVYVIIVFIVNFFSLFTDIGLSLAIIQKNKEPTREELSNVFVLKILLSLLIIALIWMFAPFLKLFNDSFAESNVLMLRILSFTLLFASLRTIPISLLERKIKYDLISIIDIIGVLIYYAISISGAFLGFGVWSFILGAISKEIGETFVLYYIRPFFPKLIFSIKSIKNMIRFGVYLQGNSFVNIIQASIIPVIAGKTNGVHAVGFLDFSFSIASLPEVVAQNFGRVAFASYSRIQEEKELLNKSIHKSISMLSILLYIFPVIVFSMATEIIPVVFSEKWIPAITSLYWFSAGTFFLPFIASLGQSVLVLGRSRENFWFSFIIVILGWIVALVLSSLFGFVGIASAYFLMTVSYSLFYILFLKRYKFELPITSLIFPKLLVAGLSFVLLIFLNFILPQTFLILIFKILVGVLVYAVLMFLIIRKDTVEFLGLIRQWLNFKFI